MRKSLATVVTLSSVVALFAACSSKKPNPPMTPTVPPMDDAGLEAGAEEAGAALDDAGAAADAGPTFFTGGDDAGVTGPVALGEAALDSAIDLAIATSAPKLAPKMDKEGQPGRATLKEGEHFAMMVNLAPNRCYTIIANSPPGNVEKLELKLYGPPLFNIEAGKSGANDKNMPVIGKGTAALCPIVPLAVPYKIDVGATKGAGRIGVQVFARNK